MTRGFLIVAAAFLITHQWSGCSGDSSDSASSYPDVFAEKLKGIRGIYTDSYLGIYGPNKSNITARFEFRPDQSADVYLNADIKWFSSPFNYEINCPNVSYLYDSTSQIILGSTEDCVREQFMALNAAWPSFNHVALPIIVQFDKPTGTFKSDVVKSLKNSDD
jgi:hypothetical protein